MQSVIISALNTNDNDVEVVERKGIGHPDTICDALAETLSRNLCREYRKRFGNVLHHNVDKALLRGGRAAPAFGGGTILAPISIYLAGRAVTEVGGEAVPIDEIALEGSRAWLRANLHALDADHHVEIHNLIRPGSQDLQELFSRQYKVPLANDTSVGLGYAPMSPLERLVLAVEKRINGRDRNRSHPAWGEDIKIMGVRCGATIQLTVACAMIGGYLSHIGDYFDEKAAVEDLVRNLAIEHGFPQCSVNVNMADDPRTGAVYLTVTGTSAEAGDDGQVGRGNRVNGLITPYRPMILEAVAGKNPVSHVGKIYNVVAREIAETLVATEPDITAAQCLLMGQIGSPITEPALLHIKLATRDGTPVAQFERRVDEIAHAHLGRTSELVDDFIAGAIEVF
ncbi:MAG: methionine adenosyltransferase [Xanthobacteraceae bacterium]